VTPDLDRLRGSLDQRHDLLQGTEFNFVDDPHWAEPSETSYLTTADLPAIASDHPRAAGVAEHLKRGLGDDLLTEFLVLQLVQNNHELAVPLEKATGNRTTRPPTTRRSS
jgi:hypothetical protein